MANESKQLRRDILKLEKQMQRKPTAKVVLSLAEKYADLDEPHQAVAVLLEGIDTFPGNSTLMVICAKFMVKYQTDDIIKAEALVKQVLMDHPDNLMAQQVLEEIHAQVDTMHEVAYAPDTDVVGLRESLSELLESQKTKQVPTVETDDLPPFHEELTKGYRSFHEGDIDSAFDIFQSILEEDPDNQDAREGFRLSYAARLKAEEDESKQEKLEQKLEVVRRSVHFLEAMRKVVSKDLGDGSENE